jgi:tetratricopeptide (TPR) repeat protein
VTTRLARGAAAMALAGAAAGCVYFNGMYNANRYARQAASAERAGKTAEAHAAWQQAAEHAESLVVHHPKSGWAGKAQLVQGRALVHLEAYSDAAVALRDAVRRRLPREQHLEALLLLARAELFYRQYDSAAIALDSAVRSKVPQVRDEALLYRGRVWRALGNLDSASSVLRRSRHPVAAFDLAEVELRRGDTAAAGAVYDSLARAKGFVEARWRAALDSLAAAGAVGHASLLAERLAARRHMAPGTLARLWLDDASRRLAAGDTGGAVPELQHVVRLAGDSVEGRSADVTLVRVAIARATSDSELGSARTQLTALTSAGGGAGREAATLVQLLVRVEGLGNADSLPDAKWFERAEMLRDSLGASRLAATDFAAMATRFPDSPWTPKGLVAAIAAGYPAPDSLRDLLSRRYAESPYTVAAFGGAARAGALAMLEDSLRDVLAMRTPAEDRRELPDRARHGVRVLQAERLERGGVSEGPRRAEEPRQARRAVSQPSAAPPPGPTQPPPRPPYGPPGPEPPE